MTTTPAASPECTCPNGDTWACIEGRIYGPCSAENCYGVCEWEGYCDCEADTHRTSHDE